MTLWPADPLWPKDLADREAQIIRLDDSLDAAALQARREQLDRLAEPAQVTDDQALRGGSVWLAMLMLAAGIAGIAALGLLAKVLMGGS
jgi:hypothetical protein